MKNVLKVATLAVLGCAFIGGETQGMWDKLQASVAKNPRKVNQYRAKRGLAPLDPAQIRAAAKPTGGQRFGGTVNSKNSVLNDQSSSDEEEVVLSTENLDEELEGQQSQLTQEQVRKNFIESFGRAAKAEDERAQACVQVMVNVVDGGVRELSLVQVSALYACNVQEYCPEFLSMFRKVADAQKAGQDKITLDDDDVRVIRQFLTDMVNSDQPQA